MSLCAPAAAAPRYFSTGFFDGIFQSPDATARGVWLGRARRLDARYARLTLPWSVVAPATRPEGFRAADPASRGYDWSRIDAAVTDATQHGLIPVLTIQRAPTWAEGRRRAASAPPGTWQPRATAFADFAR